MASYEQSQTSKLWSVRFRIMSAEGATQHKRLSGFRTKKEAQKAYNEFMADYEALPAVAGPEEMTFKALADEYLEHLSHQVKESTLVDVKSKVKSQLIPFFGSYKIKDITPLTVVKWQNSTSEYSYNYRSDLRTRLKAIFSYAERYYDIPNVMHKVEPIRNVNNEYKEMDFYTPDEINAVVERVKSKEHAILYRFLFIMGARKGEALALTWGDIDCEKKQVSITKSLTRKSASPYAITTTKNLPSTRKIPLPDNFCDELKKHREDKKNQGVAASDKDFVFGSSKPLSDKSVTRYFDEAAEEAGIRRIRIHDLRHSCASNLISSGASIVAVSAFLGHKDTKQTLNTYAHLMPSDTDRIVSALSNLTAQTFGQ